MIPVFVSCRAVIIRDGKILLIHRKKDGREYWVFPGGHIEKGETAQEAIKREVLEETNLKVTGLSQPYPYKNKTFNESECFFVCQTETGRVCLHEQAPEKITDNDWYNPEWISLSQFANIEPLYPQEVRKLYLDTT